MTLGKLIEPTEQMKAILNMCVDWYGYSGNECGGELHVVLDDDNTDTHWLNEYMTEAIDKNYDNYALAISILNGLLSLSPDQRNWVTYNIYEMLESGTTREIFEEIEDPV